MLTSGLILRFYHHMRLLSYRDMFQKLHEKYGSLSATEAFSVDVIYLLNEPTLSEFAAYLQISQPNATYKVNSLVTKGYLVKRKGEADRRECRLCVTEKYRNYCCEDSTACDGVLNALRQRFSAAELENAGRVLAAMIDIGQNRTNGG